MSSDAFIPLSVPCLQGREAAYLAECIAGGWVSSVGPFVERFERDAAAYLGVPHVVATASGTAALHLALLTAGVQPFEEVLVSNLTFIAPANAVRYVGALPVFIGSEADYWQIDPAKVRSFLEGCERRGEAVINRVSGRQIRALIVVHILGHPVDLEALADIAREFKLVLIEDCAEAIGTEYKGRRVGSTGEFAVFSFNGNKIVTCGGGGLLVSQDAEMSDWARHLSTQARNNSRETIHETIGYNYRLTNLQAAVGCAQLEQLDGFITRKRALAARYREELDNVPGLAFMQEAPWARSTYWLNTVLVNEAEFGLGSRPLMDRLAEAGIQSRPLWQPMHLSPAQRAQAYQCEIDGRLWAQALSLPSSPQLTEDEQTRVIEVVQKAAAPV